MLTTRSPHKSIFWIIHETHMWYVDDMSTCLRSHGAEIHLSQPILAARQGTPFTCNYVLGNVDERLGNLLCFNLFDLLAKWLLFSNQLFISIIKFVGKLKVRSKGENHFFRGTWGTWLKHHCSRPSVALNTSASYKVIGNLIRLEGTRSWMGNRKIYPILETVLNMANVFSITKGEHDYAHWMCF